MTKRKKVATPQKSKKIVEALEKVLRVEEIEALRFAKLDTEIRNAQQAVRLADFELDKARREYEAQVRALQSMKVANESAIQSLKPSYTALVAEIAQKYGIEPGNVIIDPDTLIIRDGSKG